MRNVCNVRMPHAMGDIISGIGIGIGIAAADSIRYRGLHGIGLTLNVAVQNNMAILNNRAVMQTDVNTAAEPLYLPTGSSHRRSKPPPPPRNHSALL